MKLKEKKMKNKNSLLLFGVGMAFIILGCCLIMYNSYEDKKAGIESKKVVEQIQDNPVESVKIDNNEYIGIINIPTLNLELPVMSDWSYEKMKISPVRYYGSFETDDLVICAHSYKTFFRYIKNLVVGDILIFTDMGGNSYLYKVEVIENLGPTDIKEMIENEFDLTLFTCTSDSQNRVTVRLDRVDNQIAIK